MKKILTCILAEPAEAWEARDGDPRLDLAVAAREPLGLLSRFMDASLSQRSNSSRTSLSIWSRFRSRSLRSLRSLWGGNKESVTSGWKIVARKCVMCRFVSQTFFLVFTYISDGVKQFSHSLPSFQLGLLHGLKFDKNRVNLGHDAADGMFHAIHAAAETKTQTTEKILV